MLGLEEIVCWSRVYEAEEYFPCAQFCSPSDMRTDYWDVIDDGNSARELGLKEEQNKSAAYYHWQGFTDEPSMGIAAKRSTPAISIDWVIRTPLRARFHVLDDWATALHAHHVKGVVHGNLTPKSVGIDQGRGTLRSPWKGWFSDCQVSYTVGHMDDVRRHLDDVHGARWAATELFRINNDDLRPTTMSDVYSFACLMLQVLTGEVPYCGTKRSEQVVYLKYLGREPIDAQTPKVADRYVAFMRWCWSPEPEQRPTMETVVRHIRQEIERLGEEQRD